MEASQSKIISISTKYGPAQRQAIGSEIISFIRNRTRTGLDINGRPFAGYSTAYKNDKDFDLAGKSSTVNMSLTGEMLGDLEVLSHGPGFIKIGFSEQSSNDKAAYIQNPRGQKAGKQPRRQFVGISPRDLNVILGRFDANDSNFELATTVAQGLLRRILGGS